ncbi:MAG: hypothetical protein QXS93_00515 [Candidatus Micrarchaeia archaeon]
MCDVCNKISSPGYSSAIGKYMLEDVQRLMNISNGETEPRLLFSQVDFPFIEPLIYLEPRVALPKPTRYYQGIRIDSQEMRLDWSAGSTRALGLKNSTVILLCKAATKKPSEPEKLDHYFLIKLGKGELKVSEANSIFTISFKGHVDGMNIKDRKIEGHDIEFSFQHHHNDNAIVPTVSVGASAIYGGKMRTAGSTQVLSRFENYSITVSHFAPHPLMLQSCKELGFNSPIEMQRAVYGMLKWHLL